MPDPITLTILTAFMIKNAPAWFASLSGTILDKSRDAAFDKGKDLALAKGERLRRRIFHLDEKEQLRHLEQALKNATERGLALYRTPQERDRYSEILQTLSQPGPSGKALRHEMMQIFTLSEIPDFAALTAIYNQHQRLSDVTHQDIDVAPYLEVFFSALLGELYADPYFRPQLNDILPLRAARSMQISLLDVISALQKIGATLEENYSADDLARDINKYTAHIERTLHHLKIVGVVPKDQNVDPELSGIFVPLRIGSREQAANADQQQESLVAALEHSQALVLLGGPGSGKSTATKHLAWSHVAASQLSLPHAQMPLLLSNPLPLRIELRLLAEERKRANYDFLSFATEVLLKREGVEINPQMFKELLTRRGMMLLFDGLDEVATLEERLGFVNEIEHFALYYPGNYFLVTSRPVGYDLVRFSHPLFSHAEIQPFDDTQIQRFLENWYTSVLRLSPIPHLEQEEMDLLLTMLQENPRLHKLAENPLLLTVMTALHRYERLPDRRVQVYDRCADLLLETWGKLRGTNKRWQDMKMIKEEQYACVAYLGFILHEHSQEEIPRNDEKAQNMTVDVTSRFLRKKVEDFLRQRKLITEVVERQAEAKRFITLIQEEAGLIVERGTDENGEALYSFVHRTFQEYFAAADIYERYLQKEDPKIISAFLREHLHDSHWREVTILLLGKLKSTPATNQLRQILQGKIKNVRSNYTQIVQQDLFFACDCLIEGITVEIAFAEHIVKLVSNVVKASPFLAQQVEALQMLISLSKIPLYSHLARTALESLTRRDVLADALRRGMILFALYLNYLALSEERQKWEKMLAGLVQEPNLPIKEFVKMVYTFHLVNRGAHMDPRNLMSITPDVKLFSVAYPFEKPEGILNQELMIRLLTNLTQRVDLSIDELLACAEALYEVSFNDSEEQSLAAQILLSLTLQLDLSAEFSFKINGVLYKGNWDDVTQQTQVGQIWISLSDASFPIKSLDKVARTIYNPGPNDSEEQKRAKQTVFDLIHGTYSSIEEFVEVANILYKVGPNKTEELKLVERMLTYIFRLSAFVHSLISAIPISENSEIQKWAWHMLGTLASWADLNIDVFCMLTIKFYDSGSPTREYAKQMALNIAQQISLPYQLYIHTSRLRRENGPAWLEIKTPFLLHLLQRDVLSTEERIEIASVFYEESSYGSEEREWAKQVLLAIAQQDDLSVKEFIKVTNVIHKINSNGSEEKTIIKPLLLNLFQRTGLTIEQIVNDVLLIQGEENELRYQILLDLTQKEELSIDQFIDIAHALVYFGFTEAINLGYQMLLKLMQIDGLSTKQSFEIAYVIYKCNFDNSVMKQWAKQTINILYQHNSFPVNQFIKISCELYQHKYEFEKQEWAKQMLLNLSQRTDLSIEQFVQLLHALYTYSYDVSYKEGKLAVQLLQDLMVKPTITSDQRLQIIKVMLKWGKIPYAAMIQAVSILLSMFSIEQARAYLEIYKIYFIENREDHPSDIPYLVELVQSELLSFSRRDIIYQRLRNMIAYSQNNDIRLVPWPKL